MGAARRACARPRKLSRAPNCSGRFVARSVCRLAGKSVIWSHILAKSGGVEWARDLHGANARSAVAKRSMDGCLHLQGCARRHGGGAWLGLPTLVHYSIATRIDCAARIKREIFRRTFLAGGFGKIFVAQASCLRGNRASRLVDEETGRQDARWPHRQDVCATSVIDLAAHFRNGSEPYE